MVAAAWTSWVADALILFGLAFASLSVLGIWRLPDVYSKLHAAGKMASLGIASFALATALSTDLEIAARALLVAVFVVLTAAVTSHAIARAAADRDDRLQGRGSFDESSWHLDRRR